MIRLVRPSLGLAGRILVILLLTVLIEFAASTFLYERASRFSGREDEARRLAEHLVIARRLVAERPVLQRPAMAGELSTERYLVRWVPHLPPPPPIAPDLIEMRRQILAWEASLARSDLRLRLTSPGRGSMVTGGLRLPDRTWLYFSTREGVHRWDLTAGRIVLALTPAIALLLIGAALVRRTLRPMDMLARAADGFGRGIAVADLPESGTGEVRRVIRAFNAMRHRIDRLIGDRTQALAAVGHDLRTPLARLTLRVGAIEDADVREAVIGDVGEMRGMLDSLLAYLGGEGDPERPVRIDLAVMAATLVDDATDRGLAAEYVGDDHLEAVVRPIAMKRALSNLVENALHYGDAARVAVRRDGGAIMLEVADDGPGIPEDKLVTVLQPFIRMDEARRRNTNGLGLGLAIVDRAVRAEGGTLALVNGPYGGLTVRIALPEQSAT